MGYYMSTYEYELYITTEANLKKTLDKYGVAIIPSVLNDDECDETINGIWSFFEHLTQKWELPINRNNKKSWELLKKLAPIETFIYKYWSVGHAQVCWDLRQKEKIINIFATLWNCNKEDLLVSFDGFAFQTPQSLKINQKENTLYHTDQSYTRNNFECIQSWVTSYDVNENDATLAIMEGSHKYHGDFSKYYNITNKQDWYTLSDKEQHFYIDKGCQYKKIKCPKGSMVFWDSRTIHYGAESINSSNPNFRAVNYLCYMPKKLASNNDLDDKLMAYKLNLTTSHCPTKITCESTLPLKYNNIMTFIGRPKLTKLGNSLIGL
jgi:ectoine hydroxylase-related dioxygenase (phytanoyl-CoA dioxygenase family)